MSETNEGGGFGARVAKFVERATFRAADRIVVIHPRFAEFLIDELDVAPERVTVIRNWTHLKPTPPISKEDARRAIGWTDDWLLAVHTGNMGAKQGLVNVVEAARLADALEAPIKFVLVGDGCERSRLEQLAEGIERIIFVDPLDTEDYRYALAAADCLLVNELPGVANMAVPSKLTSYFAAARPVLAATDPNGITASEIELAGAGAVVPAGNPESLLQKALELSDDNANASTYGEAGGRFCSDFLTASAALAAFEQVIEDVASRRVGPSTNARPPQQQRQRSNALVDSSIAQVSEVGNPTNTSPGSAA